MQTQWIAPAAVSAAGLIAAGGVAWTVKYIGKTFRRAVAETVGHLVGESLAGLKSELDVRFDHNDEQTKDAAEKADQVKLEMARQFGGNGGGLRQAINELTRDVAYIKGTLGVAPEVTVRDHH